MDSKTSELVAKFDGDLKAAYVSYRSLQDQLAKGTKEARDGLLKELADELVAIVEVKDARGRVSQNPKHNAKIRRAICRLIGCFGNESQVAVLKQMLEEENVRESARSALDQIPGKPATDALVDAALNSFGEIFRIGVIGSLANRRGEEVISALKACLEDPSEEVMLAAAESLSMHADVAYDQILIDLAKRVQDNQRTSKRIRYRLTNCRIFLAEALKRAGQREAGNRIFMSLQKATTERPFKNAARIGMGGLQRVEKK